MRKYLQRNIKGSLGAVSSTTTYTSAWQTMDYFQTYGIQIAWTGTPVATVSLLVSMDPVPPLGTFTGVAGGPSTPQPVNIDVVTGSAISTSGIPIITYDNLQTAANWIAVQWVNASGTGTINSINLVAKGSQT